MITFSIDKKFLNNILGEPKQLDLGNGLFLGGLPWQQYDHRSFPVSLWSATLKSGFVGCVSDLTLNKQSIDIMRYAQEQDTGKILSIETGFKFLHLL